MNVRTRFAPSPTGFLHVGGVRTALFAWLVAKQAGGEFLLRIEDTDRQRHIESAEKHIIDSLEWLGLKPDEQPLRQSERLGIYKEWGQKLVATGRAYADPYSEDELEKLRQQAKQAKKPFLFRDFRPKNPPAWDGSQPLRFKSQPKAYSWQDEVLGKLSAGAAVVDDFILVKSDGYPTYNFAHIVDDSLSAVTHVIRSQEFLPSVPKFLNLYEALGLERPKFATLPYVLGADGKKKLSKRDGAKDILEYQRQGYLPEALVSFLATLGWNDGSQQEIFTVKELIEKFDLKRVQRSGARFDEQRLDWVNGHFIRELHLAELYDKAGDFWPPEAADYDTAYKKQVLALVQERLKFLAELPNLTNFFFKDLPVDMKLITENKQLSRLPMADLREYLQQSRNVIESSDFSHADLSQKLNGLLESTGQKPGVLFSLIRIATTWAPASPELAGSLQTLGKARTLARLDQAIQALQK